MSGKVLLVDDEQDFLDALALRISNRGMEVTVATSAEEALAKVANEPFDAIILDLMMPKINGLTLLKAIKTDRPELQVILLTGFPTLEKSIEAMKSGALDFIGKPADVDQLAAIVQKAKAQKMILVEKQLEDKIKKIIQGRGWKCLTLPGEGFMKPKILIVDDEVAFAQILTDRLSMLGFQAEYCPSGLQALNHIRTTHVDVVILDIMMPHMDGIATLRAIKDISALVEVILLSGEATLQTAIEGLRQGAFEYLTKPCDTSIMTAKIDAAFQRKCAQEARIAKALAEIDSLLKKHD